MAWKGPLLALPLAVLACSEPRREVAITFDDLPVVSRRDWPANDTITARLISALRKSGAPIVGFVNEEKLYAQPGRPPDPSRVALLTRWVAAGFELGNHTYSHADLHAVGPDRFLAEIARGDSVTSALLAARGQRPRFFRHPYLHTGLSLTIRSRVDSALSARGYRVAPVTIDDRDWEFAAAYEKAIERRDAGLKERVATAYLAYMDVVFGYYEAESRGLLGRELPQILLLHSNALNADRFGALAGMMARRGYRFVTLDEALADPAYRLPDRYTGPRGLSWLLRWAITRGARSPGLDDEPRSPAFVRRLAAPTGR